MSGRERPRGPVDWAGLRGRVQATGERADGETPDAAQQRRTLDERARALARPPAAPLPTDTLALVIVSLGGEAWGGDARLVWEAFRLAAFTPLPGAAEPVAGITAWRGSVITVLDLRPVLGIPTTPLADLGFGLVIGDDRPAFAVLADAVGEITTVDPRALREPQEGVAVRREYVLGVTPAAVFVLDLPRLLRTYR
ncbi:MAG TPA: chemotaxis protein CheW [Gemmatimonadales bacterium]